MNKSCGVADQAPCEVNRAPGELEQRLKFFNDNIGKLNRIAGQFEASIEKLAGTIPANPKSQPPGEMRSGLFAEMEDLRERYDAVSERLSAVAEFFIQAI
jgi:hypothetical protein